MTTNANLTTANDLHDRVCELLAHSVTLEVCRAAMHELGWTRYESLTTEQVDQIADAVAATLVDNDPCGPASDPWDVISDGKIIPREELS